MDETPHPSTLSEVLDRTLQIYRQRFLVFVGIAAAPYAAILAPVCGVLLLGLWLGNAGPGSDPSLRIAIFVSIGVLVGAPVWIGATAISTAALNHAAAHRYFDEPVTIRGAWKEAWARGWRYTGLYLLEVLLIWVAPSAVWILLAMANAAFVVVLRNSLGAGAAVLGGLLLMVAVAGLVAYGLWMLLRLALAFPASVVERIGVGQALRRGPSLSRGAKGRIFLLYVLGAIVNYLLILAAMIPLAIALALIPALQGTQHAGAASELIVVTVYGMGIAAQALTKPVYSIALVLFYFDQRIRHEAFDIEWMMMRAGLVAPAAPEPQPSLPLEPADGALQPALAAEAASAAPEPPLPESAEPAAATPGETS